METYKPKSIKDAINCLQQFLECDMPSKVFPDEYLSDGIWTRKDNFKDKKEITKYIEEHFEILKKQIRTLFKAQPKSI